MKIWQLAVIYLAGFGALCVLVGLGKVHQEILVAPIAAFIAHIQKAPEAQ
jgi:hypothetical protein